MELEEASAEGETLSIEQPAVPFVRRFKKSFAIVSGTLLALVVLAGVHKVWKGEGVDVVEGKASDVMSKALWPPTEKTPSYYSEPAEVDKSVQKDHYWKQEDPSKYITTEEVNIGICEEGGEPTDGFFAKPDCKAPANGWPGLVIVSGRGGAHERYNLWPEMLAGRGIAGVDFDMCPANAAPKAQWPKIIKVISWMKEKSDVNPDDITLMGYSAGGNAVNEFIFQPEMLESKVKNIISLAGLRGPSMDLFDEFGLDTIKDDKFPNYLALQAMDDSMMGFGSPEKFVAKLKDEGKTAHEAYWYWGDHQPSMQTDFYYLMQKFIKDPKGFEGPRAYTSGGKDKYPKYTVRNMHYGGDVTEYDDVDPQKDGDGNPLSCLVNGDATDPTLKDMTINLWGGPTGVKTCAGMCTQNLDCKYFEMLAVPKLDKVSGEKVNCVGYTKPCENPKFKTDPKSVFKKIHKTWEEGYELAVCNPDSPDFPGK